MRHPFVLALTASLIALLAIAGVVLATPISGVTTTTFAVGRFDNIDAKTLTDIDPTANVDYWQARINTKGSTDVYMLENRIAPGGTFGWHAHPGPSIVLVKAGTLTLYRGTDPTCTPQVVEAGSGFVDDGGDIHMVRNEGSVDTVVYVVSLVPAGFPRRIDEPAPSSCPY
ncbi:MAG TPA: cupin domain-containing protein [Verrucomicrobiae bacterium]|jgi:quercetin dioxygenase-like cupin family protein|nr:cupin domain-containing protein [Verrucomicrobiae bacterium]